MKTIYKYLMKQERINGGVKLELPRYAIIRHLAAVGDEIYLWAEINTSEPKEIRYFDPIATGQDIPHGYREFVGTALLYGGQLVFHFYEIYED